MKEDTRYWIALNMIPGVGRERFKRLIEEFGSPKGVLDAPYREIAKVPGIGFITAQAIARGRERIDIDQELDLVQRHKVKIITLADESYPADLAAIFDPPSVLYIKGQLLERDRISIAIVGSRRATTQGKAIARRLSYQLASKGLTIVSGMARGIDSAAHRGALALNGGRSIAVLGCGIDVVYPPENKELMNQIAQSGAVVSEFPMSTPPHGGNFPQRNRVISGLSLGVVVVEAAERSGAMVTVDCALEQGRDVFAVPGSIDGKYSKGTNRLIKQGAKLVQDSSDIVEELGLPLVSSSEGLGEEVAKPSLSPSEETVYQLLSSQPQHIDVLIQKSKISPGQIAGILMNLEVKGLVKELAGKNFIRK